MMYLLFTVTITFDPKQFTHKDWKSGLHFNTYFLTFDILYYDFKKCQVYMLPVLSIDNDHRIQNERQLI